MEEVQAQELVEDEIREMFPYTKRNVIIEVLKNNNYNASAAIDELLAISSEVSNNNNGDLDAVRAEQSRLFNQTSENSGTPDIKDTRNKSLKNKRRKSTSNSVAANGSSVVASSSQSTNQNGVIPHNVQQYPQPPNLTMHQTQPSSSVTLNQQTPILNQQTPPVILNQQNGQVVINQHILPMGMNQQPPSVAFNQQPPSAPFNQQPPSQSASYFNQHYPFPYSHSRYSNYHNANNSFVNNVVYNMHNSQSSNIGQPSQVIGSDEPGLAHVSNVTCAANVDPSSNRQENSEQVTEEVTRARKEAEKQLALCRSHLTETSLRFSLQQLQNNDGDFVRITDKCKIFFNLYANCTVEIKEIMKIRFPENEVHYWQKAIALTVPAVHVELYKADKMLTRELTSVDEIYKMLQDKSGGLMYELYKYAKPETAGKCTLVIADVLMGNQIDSSDEHDNVSGPAPYWVCYRNQIQLKYVVNLVAKKVASAKKISRFTDVPDIVAAQNDGVLEVEIKHFDFRNASDPYCDILMKATALYNGDCVRRQSYNQYGRSGQKKEIKRIGIVVCHDIWGKYEEKLPALQELGGREIYGYHATAPTNVQSIAKHNLDWQRNAVHGRAYGNGCYFSEYPEFSIQYNQQCMLIFKLILLPNQYKRHKPSRQGYCEQIIIWDNTLFKPVYVLYF